MLADGNVVFEQDSDLAHGARNALQLLLLLQRETQL